MNQAGTAKMLANLAADHGHLNPRTPDQAEAIGNAWGDVTSPDWVTPTVARLACKLWRNRPANEVDAHPVLRPDVFRIYLQRARITMERREDAVDALAVTRRALAGSRYPARKDYAGPAVPLRQRDPARWAALVERGERAFAAARTAYADAIAQGRDATQASAIAEAARNRINNERTTP